MDTPREPLLLGSFEFRVDGVARDVGGPKQRGVLAMLALSPGVVVGEDVLLEGIWGEALPANPTQALQALVSRLRRAIDPTRRDPDGGIARRGSGYALDLADLRTDLMDFRDLVRKADDDVARGDPHSASVEYQQALALWRGPALEDLRGLPALGRWAVGLDEERLHAVERRIAADLNLGAHPRLVAELTTLVREHPYREMLRAQLMLALYRCGRQPEALAVYTDTKRLFAEELGLDPSRDLEALHRQLLAHEPPDAPHAPPSTAVSSPRRVDRPRVDLPATTSPLIGREAELSELIQLTRAEGVRLVTLVGPGGTGKTRLALSAAHALAPDFPGACVFVDLSGLLETPLLLPSVAARFDDHPPPSLSALDVIAEAIDDGPALLVLDNLEQLPDAGRPLAELLARVAELHIIATSRIPLRARAERIMAVGGLVVDEVAPADPLETPAVRLLVARMEAADPGFRLSDSEITAATTICRRLEGLPLAIELAASRAQVLGLPEVARRLRDQFRILGWTGAVDLPTRQQTLRATIDWSVNLLPDGISALFPMFGVFSGPFTIDAVSSVVAGDADAAEVVGQLVMHQLLRRHERDGELTFDMPDTVRSYARQRLEEAGKAPQAQRRHTEHYLEIARRLAEDWHGPSQSQVVRSYARHLANFRAALRWTADAGQRRLGLQLAHHLVDVWMVTSAVTEGRTWLERLLELPEQVPLLEEVEALNSTGRLAFLGGGDLTAAHDFFVRGRDLAVTGGDEALRQKLSYNLAAVAQEQGDYQRSQRAFREYVDWAHRNERPLDEAYGLNNLGEALLAQGRADEAAGAFGRCYDILEGFGDIDRLAASAANRSRAALAQGNSGAAVDYAVTALERIVDLGGWGPAAPDALLAAAAAVLDHGDVDRASDLLGCCDALVQAHGAALQPSSAGYRDELVAELQSHRRTTPVDAHGRPGQTDVDGCVQAAIDHLRSVLGGGR